MNVQTGEITSNVTDSKLQELAMQVLVPQAGFPSGLQAFLNPSLIQGIINAERKRWQINDEMPSIPDAWGQALFAMSLPVKGVAEMDDAGWVAAGGAAGGAAVAILFSNPVGWGILAGMGLGIALLEGAYAIGGVLVGNPNSSVGRGQITQEAWSDAAKSYGEYFLEYLDNVMQEINLKGQMEGKLVKYKLNDISVKYNPMNKKHVKVLENFMIGAVLLKKIQGSASRISEGRSAESALKYGIAAYHGVDMNAINTALDRYGALDFPASREDSRLQTDQQDHLRYVDEVYDYAQSH